MRTRLLSVAVIAGLTSAMMAIGSYTVPSAQAQTRITVGGGGPLYYPDIIAELPVGRLYLVGTREETGQPLSILEGYDLLNHMIGENWFPGSAAQVVKYPASMGLVSGSLAAPGVDDAVAMGRASLDDQIKNAASDGEPVAIAGLSEGTLVINRELAHLATDGDAPPPELLSFVLFSNPELGLLDIYLPTGTTVPLVDYTRQDLADSQYDVSVVFHQYDAWADPPDRPWNLLALVNSLLGTIYFHDGAALAVPADTVVLSSSTSTLGGTTTTYMIPSSTVPLVKPLQQLGVPTQIVDTLNSSLKPIVDTGYSRLTPDAGPYFSHGRIEGLTAPFGSRVTARVEPTPSAAVTRVEGSATVAAAHTTFVRDVDSARGVADSADRSRSPRTPGGDPGTRGTPRRITTMNGNTPRHAPDTTARNAKRGDRTASVAEHGRR